MSTDYAKVTDEIFSVFPELKANNCSIVDLDDLIAARKNDFARILESLIGQHNVEPVSMAAELNQPASLTQSIKRANEAIEDILEPDVERVS